MQPQPLLVQGEADATRIDIATRMDGRVGQRPEERGDNVTAGQVLVSIDNPQLVAKLRKTQAAEAVAVADLTRSRSAPGPRSSRRARRRSKRTRRTRPWRNRHSTARSN